ESARLRRSVVLRSIARSLDCRCLWRCLWQGLSLATFARGSGPTCPRDLRLSHESQAAPEISAWRPPGGSVPRKRSRQLARRLDDPKGFSAGTAASPDAGRAGAVPVGDIAPPPATARAARTAGRADPRSGPRAPRHAAHRPRAPRPAPAPAL